MKTKHIIAFLALLSIISCDMDQGSEEALGTEETETAAAENVAPAILLECGTTTLSNGSSLSLCPEIDDPDDFYFSYLWSVDGVEVCTEGEFTFSASPEEETSYTITLTVSDGKAETSYSLIITVEEPAWEPEVLTVYFFEEGVEPGEDLWVQKSTGTDSDDYYDLCRAYRTRLEIYNRDNDPDVFIVYGGTE